MTLRPAQSVSLTVKLTPRAHQRLHDMAKASGYQASLYAQMLFDAAYAARVGMEIEAEPSDAVLDAMCRAVLALAGSHDPKAIARATGIAEATVDRILGGWREAGKGPAKKAAPAAPAKPTPVAPPAGGDEEDSGAEDAQPALPRATKSESLGIGGRRVLDVLTRLADAQGRVAVSILDLCRQAQLADATVSYHLGKLLGKRLIVREREGRPGAPSVYRVVQP